MTALALSLLLAAADADVPRLAVFGYPVSTAAMAVRGDVEGEWGLSVPLGVKVWLTDTTALDFEASIMGLGQSGSSQLRGWAASFAAGPAFRLWRGLWLDAHARFTLLHPYRSTAFKCPPGALCAQDNNGPIDMGPGRTRAFTTELDLGYEWRFGALFIAPSIGIGGGYAFDYVDPTGVRLLSPFSARTTANNRKDGFVWTLNLNVIRLGVSL